MFYLSSPRHVVVADHDRLGLSGGSACVDERAALPRLLGVDALLDGRVRGLVPELGGGRKSTRHAPKI